MYAFDASGSEFRATTALQAEQDDHWAVEREETRRAPLQVEKCSNVKASILSVDEPSCQ